MTVSVDVPPAPGAPECDALAEELWRREDAGLIEYEEYVELSDEEFESVPLALPAPDGAMATAGQRPSFERFGDGYDVAQVPNRHLEQTVGLCWEMGLIED